MKKKILSLSLGLCLLTGSSALAATGPINTTSSGTTIYDFNDGKISSMSGTYTNYPVDTIKSKNRLSEGSTVLGEIEVVDTNSHFVAAFSKNFTAKKGKVYIAEGYHTAIHDGITYTFGTSKFKQVN